MRRADTSGVGRTGIRHGAGGDMRHTENTYGGRIGSGGVSRE
jgi:hypothetical protein